MRTPKSLHATVKCDLRVITDGKQVMDIKPTKKPSKCCISDRYRDPSKKKKTF